jgi:Domain of unknown function (DUF4136)
MTRLRILPWLGLLVLVQACAGKPTLVFASDPAARFSGLRTWAWYDDPTFKMPGGGSIVDGRFVDERVRKAVDRDLAKKGLEKVESGKADLYVSYHTDTIGVVSQDKYGGYDWWTMTIVVGAKYQKKGALTLDIRDADYKLVWRGEKAAIVGTNPEAVGRDIDDAVGDLLSKFPPTPGSETK